MADFVPQNAAAFLKFAQNIHQLVDTHMGDWNYIPIDAFDDLTRVTNAFEAEFRKTPSDSTRAQIARRNAAQKACEKQLRYFIRFYLRNPAVSDDILIEMGIPPIDNIRTVHKDVTETVDFVIHIKGTNNVILDFWQTGHANKARPKSYSGAVVIWALSETEPPNNEAYPFHTLATRTPFTVEFDNHDSGKRVWFKICWQNARGILGRFSEAKSAIVP